MKIINTAILLLIIFITITGQALAQTEAATGTVQSVQTYGDGRVLVPGFQFTAALCNNNGSFWIPGDHPHLEKLLSTILTAKATGQQLTVVAKTDNCWYPEITQESTTYIVLDP